MRHPHHYHNNVTAPGWASWAGWQHQYSNDPGLTCWQSGRTQLRNINISWGAAPCQSPLGNSYILQILHSSSAAYVSYQKHLSLFDRDDDHVNVSSTTSVLNITPAAVSIEWCQSQNTRNSIASWISCCLLNPDTFLGFEKRRGRFLLKSILGFLLHLVQILVVRLNCGQFCVNLNIWN